MRAIQNTNNPTEDKFKEMLQRWLDDQGSSTKHDVYTKFYNALKGIKLIAAAEDFHKKAFDDDDGNEEEVDIK